MDEYVIVEKSSLNNIADTVRGATGSTENIAVSALSNEVATAIASSGLPSGGAPYQQLVTDGEGNAKWEDRPFYTGDPVETVLVEKSTVTFTENNGLYIADFPSTFEATVGDTHKVSWDGTVYECSCVDLNGFPVIGNLSIVEAGSDTGEPFVMDITNGKGIQIIAGDTSASHTFSISRIDVPVVKIDKKYLVQPDWNQNDETAADYVKNRTHYEESLYIDYVLNMDGTEITGFSMPEIGGTITVKINGVESTETVKKGTSHPLGNYKYIGNIDFDSLYTGGTGWCVFVVASGVTGGYANPDTTMSFWTTIVNKIDPKYLPASFKPAGKSYLTFSSPNSFTLKVDDTTKHWDGTLEYFAEDKTWTVWDGTTTLSAVDNDGEYVLCLRGTGNTKITGKNTRSRWILTGSDIACIGNIENLLDYAMVASGEHPTMADDCYYYMFCSCTSLTQAPALSATTLATECYYSMFKGCTSLTQAPVLPATTLARNCYAYMFNGCTSLAQAPVLPATTLVNACYYYMFWDCTSLTQAPALPATTLVRDCYANMFDGCTSLTQAPALPATTLAWNCYSEMFRDCTSLTQAPVLPATTLARNCYAYMFNGCTSLAQAPVLPATTLANGCYWYMFNGCTSLTQAPALPATTLVDFCYYYMFNGCTSLTQAPALPATTLESNCYSNMFNGCTSLKLSSTQTGEYTQEYRIPASGSGTTATDALSNMFISTGGTFTGTPEINTTYYLSSDNMIVRETEVTTLNGYVSSMIDAAIEEYAGTAEYIISSSTPGSSKKFKIIVDDSGTISATEV